MGCAVAARAGLYPLALVPAEALACSVTRLGFLMMIPAVSLTARPYLPSAFHPAGAVAVDHHRDRPPNQTRYPAWVMLWVMVTDWNSRWGGAVAADHRRNCPHPAQERKTAPVKTVEKKAEKKALEKKTKWRYFPGVSVLGVHHLDWAVQRWVPFFSPPCSPPAICPRPSIFRFWWSW